MRTIWGIFEVKTRRGVECHVCPCTDDDKALFGHILLKECDCRPTLEDGVWVHKEDS